MPLKTKREDLVKTLELAQQDVDAVIYESQFDEDGASDDALSFLEAELDKAFEALAKHDATVKKFNEKRIKDTLPAVPLGSRVYIIRHTHGHGDHIEGKVTFVSHRSGGGAYYCVKGDNGMIYDVENTRDLNIIDN